MRVDVPERYHPYGPYPNDERLAMRTLILLAIFAVISVVLIVAGVLEGS